MKTKITMLVIVKADLCSNKDIKPMQRKIKSNHIPIK